MGVILGELLTKLTIWLALIAYAIGAGLLLFVRSQPGYVRHARWAWTMGCLFFIAHVVCAFGYYHGWSHTAAYVETARQTEELTGFRWGGGLYLNYLFGAIWLLDVVMWWRRADSPKSRPRWLTRLWQGFFLFMVFNGAVVFGKGF